MIAGKSEIRIQAFGSPCHIVVGNATDRGDEYLAIAREEIRRLEAKFSAYHPESIISRLNQDAGSGGIVSLDAESNSLFLYASALWKESKHLFDPTIHVLKACFDDEGHQLASPDELKSMLNLVGWSKFKISPQGAKLAKKGMLIDLNDCVRPYALDCVRKKLMQEGISNALIELGQDTISIGKQPDGANWLVGARVPRRGGAGITRLKLNHGGYALRGDFERCVTRDGEHFGRALSPIDGQAIPGLLSIAVIADNCLTACSAATVALLKTESTAISWLENLGFPWLAIDRQLRCHGPLAPLN